MAATAAALGCGLGLQRVTDQGNQRYAWSARLSSAASVPLYVAHSKRLDCGLLGNTSLVQQHFQLVHQPSSSSNRQSAGGTARAAATVGTVTKEPVTGIELSNTVTTPGSTTELSLVGAGVREKKIAMFKVKVYALGFYIDASSLEDSAVGVWKEKSGNELAKDESFFKALIEVPVEKALKIVLARDVEGPQFWGALDESLTPRLKASGAGAAGEEALAKLGGVFKDRALKQGTAVFLTWSQPSTLHIAVSSDQGSFTSATSDVSIDSAVLLSCLFDIYLGREPVSPSTKASIATGFSALF